MLRGTIETSCRTSGKLGTTSQFYSDVRDRLAGRLENQVSSGDLGGL